MTYTRTATWQPTARDRSTLAGTYRCDEADATVAIVASDTTLALVRRGRLTNAMRPRYRDAYDVQRLGSLLTVQRDAAGSVRGIMLGGTRSRTVVCTRER